MLFLRAALALSALVIGASASSEFLTALCKSGSPAEISKQQPLAHKMLAAHNCLQGAQPKLNDAISACKKEAYGSDPWDAAGMFQVYCPHDAAKEAKVEACIKGKGLLEDKHLADPKIFEGCVKEHASA